MADTTEATIPLPQAVQSELDAARNVSARFWHQSAAKLVNAGARLAAKDAALFEAMNRTLDRSGTTAVPDPAPVIEPRSPEQVAHDAAHFGAGGQKPEPTHYRILAPAAEAGSPQWSAFDGALRDVTSSLGFSTDAGTKFAEGIVTAASQLRDPSTRAATIERWQRNLQAAYRERLPEMQKVVDRALELAAGSGNANAATLLKAAKDNGVIFEPGTWGRLYARGLLLTAWRETRPKS